MIPGIYFTEKEVFQCNHFIWAAMLAKGSDSEHKRLAFDIRWLIPWLKNIFPVIFLVFWHLTRIMITIYEPY
jgi:hypothetical protein